MSSYHTSFTYLGFNSYENFNLIISHFDNYDSGAMESYLSVDPVYHDSYNGTRRTMYGTKYNSVYTLDITVLNPTFEEFTMSKTRAINRWLTGQQQYSWMNLLVGDEIKYRLHCYVKDVRPYKMDSRIIGFIITVESSSPWCYSPLQTKAIYLMGDKNFTIDCDSDDTSNYIPINMSFTKKVAQFNYYNADENVLEFRNNEINYKNSNASFKTATVDYDDETQILKINSPVVEDTTNLLIKNLTTNEDISIKNMSTNETINISENMIITSDKSSRIFGDDFNYTYPRFKYGQNLFKANGDGNLILSYIVPRKVGDCIDEYMGYDNISEDTNSYPPNDIYPTGNKYYVGVFK